MRRVHRREDYIPKGALKFRDRESSALVAAYESNGRFYLIGFHGRAQKPDFHYWYRNDADRRAKAAQHFQRFRTWEESRKRHEQPRDLQVGDILKSTWGYDQTNVDFYEVTKLVGSTMIEFREIDQANTYEPSNMAGHVVPMPGAYVGPVRRGKANGQSVKVRSFAWAYKVEPQMVGGVPTYQPSRYTAYA